MMHLHPPRTSSATSAVRRSNCFASSALARGLVRMPEPNLRRMRLGFMDMRVAKQIAKRRGAKAISAILSDRNFTYNRTIGVTFRYKHELDPDGIPQFGLVAEQVEKVNPDLVVRDADGKVNTVRYEAVNAMLLNEFLKEHRNVQELKSTVAKQESTIAQQQKQIEALTTGLQKVSDQMDLAKAAPQLVANDH